MIRAGGFGAVLFALAALASAPRAQDTSSGARQGVSSLPSGNLQPTVDTPHLSVRLSTSAPTVKPGAVVSLFADVAPKPRMHVYAPDQKDYIPIALTLARDPVFRTFPPRYPKAEQYFFEPLKETQFVYSSAFRIVQDVTIVPNPDVLDRARARTMLTVKGTLRYQACDDTICYMPKNVPVEWSVRLTP